MPERVNGSRFNDTGTFEGFFHGPLDSTRTELRSDSFTIEEPGLRLIGLEVLFESFDDGRTQWQVSVFVVFRLTHVYGQSLKVDVCDFKIADLVRSETCGVDKA